MIQPLKCTTMCFTGKYQICHFFHFSFYIMILKHYPMEIILHSKTRIKFTDNCKDFFFLSSGDVPKSMLLWHDMSSSDQLLLYVFASWEIPRFFCFFQKWFFFLHSFSISAKKLSSFATGENNSNIRLVLWTLTANVCHFNCNRM